MNKFNIILCFLTLLNVSFAWVAGFNPSSCMSVPSINSLNFTIMGNTSLSCYSNLSLFQGIRIDEMDCINNYDGSSAIGGIFTVNSTHIKLRSGVASGGAAREHSVSYYVNMPFDIGLYNWTSDTSASGNYFGNKSIDGGEYGNITVNTTHAKLMTHGGATEVYSIGQAVAIALKAQCSGACNSYSEIFLPNWNASYPLKVPIQGKNCNLTNNYAYISALGGVSSMMSDFKTGGSFANNSDKCRASIYFGTSILKPKITYAPGYWAYPYFYNQTSLVAYLENNTVNFIYDESSQVWFEIPLIICDDFVSVNAVSAYLFPYSGSISSSLPTVYTYQNCYNNISHYIYTIKSPISKTFYFYQYFNNSSSYNITYSGTIFNGSVSLTNTTNITITDGSYTLCTYQNGTNILVSGNAFLTGYSLTGLIDKIFLIALVAISFVVPFGAFGIIFMNDIFLWMNQASALMISVIVLVLSLVLNSRTTGLKSLGLYFAIGLAILVYFSSTSGLLGSISSITDAGSSLQTNFNTLVTSMGTYDIAGFFLGTVGVLIDMFKFLLNIPTYLYTGIFAPLQSINMNLYNAVLSFSSVITFGVVFYLIYTIYQIASNKYQNL